MRILAIESSCDETAVAIVSRDGEGKPIVMAQTIASQFDAHAEFGGVVPEIAARAHLNCMDHLIKKTLGDAEMSLDAMDAFAATAGPGLIGGLMVGVMTGKSLALAKGKPFFGVNHLEGHALTARLTDDIAYPFLLLLVSGGHTQILKVKALGDYERMATTIDDALGEAFDKTAKLLGIPHPGGPNVEKAAALGDPGKFDFPMPLRGKKTLNMSFSGLKTAVRQTAEACSPLTDGDVNDICAGFQHTVARVLEDRCRKAIGLCETFPPDCRTLVAAGGVAANKTIRAKLQDVCQQSGWNFVAPPLALCSDNAAMIGWAAMERLEAGETGALDVVPRSRWPLDETADTLVGSGRRGAKV